MVEMMHRNLAKLTALVNEILDIKYVTEPCQDNDSMTLDAEWPKDEETAVPAASGVRPTLLVVDDNAEIRALLRTMLKNSYDIVEAADGQQGLDEARRTVPDLIVSDVMMPVMDGLDMCRKVKADAVTGHIPVLMLTARTLEEQRAQGYAHGADAYLTKPFSTPVLLARIQNLLQQREMLRRIFAQSVSTAQPTTEDTKAQQLADKSGMPLAEVAEVNTFVEKLRSIIQSHLSDSDFNVERIGEEIGMSRVQLYRKTKSLTGMSPVELLRKSRLERASQLLRTTDRSISEIAYETGFSAPSYFAKCYKEEYGMSPGDTLDDVAVAVVAGDRNRRSFQLGLDVNARSENHLATGDERACHIVHAHYGVGVHAETHGTQSGYGHAVTLSCPRCDDSSDGFPSGLQLLKTSFHPKKLN